MATVSPENEKLANAFETFITDVLKNEKETINKDALDKFLKKHPDVNRPALFRHRDEFGKALFHYAYLYNRSDAEISILCDFTEINPEKLIDNLDNRGESPSDYKGVAATF